MALLKLKDLDLDYRQALGDDRIIGSSVYADATDEIIGTVKDILVDETTGKFRYLLVDLGFWIFGKKSYYQLVEPVLIPTLNVSMLAVLLKSKQRICLSSMMT